MFQESSSSSPERKASNKNKSSAEEPVAHTDWLAFLNPQKNSSSLSAQDDPFGLKKGIVLFPPDRKKPLVITGEHKQGNLQSIDEKQQDLLKDVSPVKPKIRRAGNATDVTKPSRDPVKGIPIMISPSSLKWLLLVLLLPGTTWWMISPSSQPKSRSPLPPPPLPVPPAPAPDEPDKATTTTRTKIGIPKRIINIIKQELTPFPTPRTVVKNQDASVEPSSPTTAPLSRSTPPPIRTSTTPAFPSVVNITETTKRIVHEFQSKTHKILKEIQLQIQRILQELQSKIAILSKEFQSKMQLTAKQIQSKIEESFMSAPNSEPNITDKMSSPETTNQQCEHSWKWILHRACRLERKPNRTSSRRPSERMADNDSSSSPASSSNTTGPEPTNDVSSCENLLLRKCRQQKRLLLAGQMESSSSSSSSSHSSSQQHTPAATVFAAAHKPKRSARDTRYSALVINAFGPGRREHPGKQQA